MKCCSHIEVLYKKNKNNHENTTNERDTASPRNSDELEKLFRLVIKLNSMGKTSNGSSNDLATNKSTTTTTNNTKNLKCFCCDQFTRLYVCANCHLISCFNHIGQHIEAQNSHVLWVDIGYAAIYCHICKDFQYNRLLEEFVRELFFQERFFPFGKFSL